MTELNPAQRAVADGLLNLGEAGPGIDSDAVERIRRGFTERTQWAVDALDAAGQTLWINKRTVTTVLSCEARWEAPDLFSWSLPTAVGSVAHRAAELMLVGRMGGAPLDAVVGAIELLCEENRDFAAFVEDSSAAHAAALRADATSHVASLVDGFPPLPRKTRTEQTFQANLGGRTVVLRARPDLCLGSPYQHSLLVDLKTGTPHQSHVDDLRFYALVFMLRWGAAPWRVASYYAADGTWSAEDVDADVLEAAALRTSDAVLRIAEIVASQRPAEFRPGPGCQWCSLAETCDARAEWASLAAEAAN